MRDETRGSIRVFRTFDLLVRIHVWWFAVAVLELVYRTRTYSQLRWNIAEFMALFGIVLLHEIGHALACRQVGGRADSVVLWPLGGVAFIRPPQRPAAQLWSFVAGPLVNVALAGVIFGVMWVRKNLGWGDQSPDVAQFVATVWWMNLVQLGFSLLPIFPLDGGQIVRTLLWFVIGPAKSLRVTSVVSFTTLAALLGVAVWQAEVWMGFVVLFAGVLCFNGYRHSAILYGLARLPRHGDCQCPDCGERPPIGPFWRCVHCGETFDPFYSRTVCLHCGQVPPDPRLRCVYCDRWYTIDEWAKDDHPFDHPVLPRM